AAVSRRVANHPGHGAARAGIDRQIQSHVSTVRRSIAETTKCTHAATKCNHAATKCNHAATKCNHEDTKTRRKVWLGILRDFVFSWLHLYRRSFVPQREDRIDARGAARRDISCE